ncbi:MAG: MFS transporter [Pseudomonadota bacterium]
MNDRPEEQKRRLQWVLLPALITFSMGQTVLFAVAGPAFREAGLAESQLGIVVSAAAVVFVFSSAIWGRIADRWGRRPTVLFGLWSYGLVSICFAAVLQLGIQGVLVTTTVFVGLLLLRLTYAALGAGIQPASVAMMADLSTAQERSAAVAVVGAAFGMGMILGPAAAAALVGFGLLTPLYALAGLGLVTALVAQIALPRIAAVPTAREAAGRPVGLWPILLAAMLVFLAISALQQTMAFNVQDRLQLSSIDAARQAGFCFMAIALMTLLMQGGVIQWLKPSPRSMLLIGLPVGILGFVLYALASAYWQLLAACGVIGIGFGLSNPGLTAAASLRAGPEAQGRTAGLMQAMMSAGYVFGPLTGTALYEVQPLYAPLLAGTAALAALVVLVPTLVGGRSFAGDADGEAIA